MKALPFFCHLRVDEINHVKLLEESILSIKSDSEQEDEIKDHHIKDLQNIVLVLTKANGLAKIDEKSSIQSINALHSFV